MHLAANYKVLENNRMPPNNCNGALNGVANRAQAFVTE